MWKFSRNIDYGLIHNGNAINNNQIKTVSLTVTKRENACNDAIIEIALKHGDVVFNEGDSLHIYFGDLDVNNVSVKQGEFIVTKKKTRCNNEGEIYTLSCMCRLGMALKDMRVYDEYGQQSRNAVVPPVMPVVSTVRNVFTHIIGEYVEKVGTGVHSGHQLNRDFIYGIADTESFDYLKFSYTSAYDALQELLKHYNSANFVRHLNNPNLWRGLHWTSSDNADLLVAPVGNHNVLGSSGNTIDVKWKTYALDGEVLDLDVYNVEHNYEIEKPLANVVHVLGKFIHPDDDYYTENSAHMWKGARYDRILQGVYSNSGMSVLNNSTINVKKGNMSVEFHSSFNNLGNHYWWTKVPDDFQTILGLIGKDNPLTIAFNFERQNNIGNLAFVFYTKEILGHPYNEPDKILQYPFSLEGDESTKIEIPITFDDITDASGDWTTKWLDNIPTLLNPQPLSWKDVNFMGIRFSATGIGVVQARSVYIDNLTFVCNMVKAVGDSSLWVNSEYNTNHKYKVRMLPIIDNRAYTSTVSPNETNSILTKAAIGHLLFNGYATFKVKVSIPLDPTIMAGQLLRIRKASDVNFVNNSGQTYKTMRILQVENKLSSDGSFASTTLTLCDDLRNSIVRSNDEYSTIIRAVSPDHQTATFASITNSMGWDIYYVVDGLGVTLPSMNPP